MATVRQETASSPKVRKPPTPAEKRQALWDFWLFLDILEFHGGSSKFGDCHRELISWKTEHGKRRELIIMPRGHLKSTILTVGWTMWRVYHNPNIRIFVGTATKELALAFIREIKTYFEDPWLQQHLWNSRPHIMGRMIPLMDRLARQRRTEIDETEAEDKKVIWRGDAIQVLRSQILKEPTLTVGAVGVQHTGFHFDELKMDDVVNYDNIKTPEKLKRLIRWYDDLNSVLDSEREDTALKTLLPTKAKQYSKTGGRVTVVGTRYAAEDWYNQVLLKKTWATYERNIYQNGENPSEGYLWHEAWNEEIEMDKRDETTAAVFASQYLNKIINPEEQVFAFENIRGINRGQVRLLKSGQVEINFIDEERPRTVSLFCVVDPAASVRSTADFTAIVIGGKDEFKNLYLIDCAIGRWKSEDILINLYKLLDRWNMHRCSFESVGGFKHLVEYVKAGFVRFRPITIFEFTPHGQKQVRIANALEPLVRNGMLFMMDWMFGNPEVKREFMFFPQATTHDDFLDAAAALAEIAKPPQKVVYRPMKNQYNRKFGGYR